MARPAAEIQVEGMREVRSSFRKFSTDNGWRAPLRDSYKGVAQMVEGPARARAQTRRATVAGGVGYMGSRAVASIKGKGTTTEARLDAFRGIPWGPGWNFGTTGRYRQFPAKTDPDYALYATVRDMRGEIVEAFSARIDDALEREF